MNGARKTVVKKQYHPQGCAVALNFRTAVALSKIITAVPSRVIASSVRWNVWHRLFPAELSSLETSEKQKEQLDKCINLTGEMTKTDHSKKLIGKKKGFQGL